MRPGIAGRTLDSVWNRCRVPPIGNPPRNRRRLEAAGNHGTKGRRRMTKKTAFWIFLLGTLSSTVLFLGLTWDTHRQVATLANVDKLSEPVVAGKRTFEKYNCNDCHTILGFGGYYAPDLTKVVQRVGEEGIRFRLKSPEKAFANSPRKMPNQHLSDREVADLVAFFTWVGEINNNDWPPQDSKKRLSRGEQRMVAMVGVSPGAAVFQTKGCMNCHSLEGTGGTFGPALDRIGSGMTAEEIERYVRNPRDVDPGAKMPAQKDNLSERELDEVARFLATLK
ncbi:MAG: cytochrome C [Deltaproteobacteria bacterium]|nr:MAG: cytochrome C [Deltaproteobacteria bacterium]